VVCAKRERLGFYGSVSVDGTYPVLCDCGRDVVLPTASAVQNLEAFVFSPAATLGPFDAGEWRKPSMFPLCSSPHHMRIFVW
jgi:hypothetical protein